VRMSTKPATTMIGLLRARAAAQPWDRAYTFMEDGERCGDWLTWEQLERRSRAIAAAVGRRVTPGQRVVVMFPPSLDFVPAFFATLFAGAIAVPVYPPSGARAERTAARLRGMITDAKPSLVLAPSWPPAQVDALRAAVPELAALPWLDPVDVPDEHARTWRAPSIDSSSLAFLQYTSGSTASPRGVMVTHGNLLHNLQQTHIDAAYDSSSVSVSWLPVNHDMGLINGVLQPAFSGCPAYLMPPAAFLQRPARWLEAISRLGATHSGAPNFAYDLCTRRIGEDDCGSLDLSSWRVAYNGSEPIRRSTLEQFQRAFGIRGFRWEALSPAYGLAESTLLVASIPAGVVPTFVGTAVASGINPAERGVVIVDPVTRARCEEGATGEIWVRGGSVAAGYWGREDDTRATFQAITADTHEGPFLRTGDMGFTHQDRLFVSGRIKDLIIVRGLKHYPQDIELTAERAHPALRAGCCAAFSVERDDDEEQLAIVAEIETRRQPRGGEKELSQVLTAIRIAVAAAHHVAPASVTLLSPGEVPKTTSGKLQRYLCRAAVQGGESHVVASWSASDEGQADYERAAS